MIRIGIYPRKSVYRDNSDSVSVQVQMCKDYASIIYQGKEIEFHVYDKDEGFSGKNTNRPSFKALMADVSSHALDVVMVYKLDRISRNVQEFSTMYETMHANDVSFVSVKESFDTSTPMGRTVMYILAAFAQLERENTSERVSDSMLSLGSSGKWTGGVLPSGMKSIRKVHSGKEHSYLVVDDDTIWRVKLLYELMLSGYTITGIERHCREQNIKSQSGKFLSTSQIHNILSNPVYCQNDIDAYYYFQEIGCKLPDANHFDGQNGLMAYGRTKATNSSSCKTSKSEWSISIGIHEWVIESEKWIATQRRLGINKQVRSNKYEVGILKGILTCKCGSKMSNRVYVKNGNMFSYYYCQRAFQKGNEYCSIRYHKIDDIDKLFIQKLKDIQLDPDCIHTNATIQDEQSSISSLKSKIKSTETAIYNLTAQLQEHTGSTAAKYIISQIESLDKSLHTVQNQLRKAELSQKSFLSDDDRRKKIYNSICILLKNFDTMDYKTKNEIIKKITKKCVLDGENLDIEF